jgi:NADPH-dependent curcumin reductase CurA
VRLEHRPIGWPRQEDFSIVESDVPSVRDGQVRVRNVVMSVDPYMRGRMSDAKSYAEPYALGQAMHGGAVGVVEESRADGFDVGDHVLHGLGWREVAVVDSASARVVDTTVAPASAYLGVLGMTGLTAYAGLTRIAPVKVGDVVFVSGAAGAVGSVAGQVAKALGASRVIGSAGSDEKVLHVLDDLGFDAAFSYRDGKVSRLLREAAPDGIDVYFDNVGGDHLAAALTALRPWGRVAMCGAISEYGASGPVPGPDNLFLAVAKNLTLRGFRGSSYVRLRAEMEEAIAPLLRAGSLRSPETVVDGLEHAPEALARLLRGDTLGKTVVRI